MARYSGKVRALIQKPTDNKKQSENVSDERFCKSEVTTLHINSTKCVNHCGVFFGKIC